MELIWYPKDTCPEIISALGGRPVENQLWFNRADAEAAVRAHLVQLFGGISATVAEHVAHSYCEQTGNGKKVVDLDTYAEVAVPLHTLRAAVKASASTTK